MNSMFGGGIMPICEGLNEYTIEQALSDASACCRFELARLDAQRSHWLYRLGRTFSLN